MSSKETIGSGQHVGSAAETVSERVRRRVRVLDGEVLDPIRISKPKCVDALVIVASDEDNRAARHKMVNEAQIIRIQVLEFVNDDMTNPKEIDGIQETGVHLVNTSPY